MNNQYALFEKLVTILVVLVLAWIPLFEIRNVTGNSSEEFHTTQGLPELSIESVIADKTQVKINERVNVEVTVLNSGDEDAAYVDIHYNINDEYQYFLPIDHVGDGDTGNVNFNFQPDAGGIFTLRFVGKDNGLEFDSKSVDIFVENETIYVDDDAADGGDGSLEHPYQKIQDAVDASGLGDTIRVFNGTYNENVAVNKRINLIGNSSETTTIDGGGNGDVIRIIDDWVNISGLKIIGSGSGRFDAGIWMESDHNHIFENTFSNDFHGIYILHSSDCTITNNIFKGNRNGIYLNLSSNNRFTYNTISENVVGIYPTILSQDNEAHNNNISCVFG